MGLSLRGRGCRSPLGVRLEISIPFAPRDLVELIFALPGEEKDTRLLGGVVWLDFGRASQ